MLKLIRRPVTEFLGLEHQHGLRARVDAARALAEDATLTTAEKSKRIGQRWDDFRAGKTSKGTFASLWCELRVMAFDKCALCETPGPGTVEHLQEKSSQPAAAFDWTNLLPACDTCNRTRQNSGLAAKPLDSSDASVEPLDYLGWDEYGDFSPRPEHQGSIRDLVTMYGLHRLREERGKTVKVFRALLASLVLEDVVDAKIVEAVRALLNPTSASLGPIREFLLRPPTEEDGLLTQGALRRMPEIRTLVQPWLRPPSWSPAWWR